jgi:hypothetical protein
MCSFHNVVGFFCGRFFPFCENYFVKNIFDHKFINVFEKNCQKTTKNLKKSTKITTIAYNLKVCLRFYIFIFWISPSLAKHSYELSPLEHHHNLKKIDNCHTTFPSISIISTSGAKYHSTFITSAYIKTFFSFAKLLKNILFLCRNFN